jgi:hypothetical protein
MIRAILVGILIASISYAETVSRPSPEEVDRAIKYTVLFAITPNERGEVQTCTFDGSNTKSGEEVNFKPSQAFLDEACALFRNVKWSVTRGQSGAIEQLWYYCYYSEAVPSHPVCDAKFHRAAP